MKNRQYIRIMGLFDKWFRKPPPSAATNSAIDNIVFDLNKVFPRLKAVFGGETPDPHPRPNPDNEHVSLSFEESPVYDDFVEGLGVFYAIDKGNRYQLLQNKDLSDVITREKLREAALNNMALEVADRTEVNGDPSNIMMLTNGGNFEAAMLLVDGMWENLAEVLHDDICVAIPARDLLFIAGKNNPMGRERLRAAVRKFFDEQETAGLLVRHIYARENNSWVRLETA
jgi:hypothetical protein